MRNNRTVGRRSAHSAPAPAKSIAERTFAAEAAHCRAQARLFVERPEGPFLLTLARAFDSIETRPSA
ncbi:MAG: hypothetical protein ABIW16_07345 [Sphingomicrobium sp.]